VVANDLADDEITTDDPAQDQKGCIQPGVTAKAIRVGNRANIAPT
jgi:hypothetical protein